MWFLWLVVAVVLAVLVCSYLLPWIIARVLSLYLGATVRIGGILGGRVISQFYLNTQAFEVSVASLRLTSSVFSSEANNLLTVIATGVSVVLNTVENEGIPSAPKKSEGKILKKIMSLAPFFGLQVRELRVLQTRVRGLPACHLVLELGELRLDSAVIYRTKLSLTCILYQGRMYIEQTLNKSILLDTNFAFQASCQALVHNGALSSVEEAKLDIDGLALQLSSALFQLIVQEKSKPSEVSEVSKLSGFTAFIPRQAEIKAEAVSVKLEHTDKLSALEADLQLLYISVKCTETPRPDYLPDSHLSLQISALRVHSGSFEEKVFELSKFQMLVQKEANLLNSDTQIHECRGRYSSLLIPWISPLSWLVKKLDKGERERLAVNPEAEPGHNLFRGLLHQHQLDAWNSDLVILDVCEWETRVHHLQGGLVGGISQFSLRQVTCSSNAKSVLQVGQMDFRLCKPHEKNQIDLMVTGTSFFYTSALYDLTVRINEVLRPLLLQLPASAPSKKPPASLALLVSQTTVVWAEENTSLQFQIREVEAAGDKLTGELTLSGVIFNMDNSKDELVWLHLPKIVMHRKPSEIKLNIDQRTKLAWRPNLHLSLERLASEVTRFRTLLSSNTKPSQESSRPAPVLNLTVTDKLSLHIHYGENSLKLRVPSVTAKLNKTGMSWIQLPTFLAKINGKQVLFMDKVLLSAVESSDKLSSERRRMEGGTVRTNQCYVFAANQLAFTEPYQFNFSKVFFEEFMGVVKWLKAKHGKKIKTDGALSKDILINVKHFKLELSDDPFEVRLRDNYELKKDEYEESQTRLRVLEERIGEFRRKNLLFPSEKVEELLQNLKKKNAEIYIQRAKKFYSTCEPRTKLLEWEMRGLEVMILADPSMHGKAEVIRHLKEFDCFSPWPSDAQLEFTTLWCRWIKVEADTFTVSLRDFPQNLLDIQTLALWGKLAGAEACPTKRAIRQHRVNVGFPFQDEFVDRNMAPLKFYYDLACDVETLSMAYGLCWEPSLTQCSLALNYVTGSSKDPSPPLPWWDKVRLLFHGRFLLAARTHRLLLHASLNPYNTTEEMDVSWSDMELIWSEAEVNVSGTLDIYVRTASKYDDGHLLHLPNLSVGIKMEWICLSNPTDHHSVMPCAPDKLPEYSSNQEHDSYRAFRSSNLDVSIQFETRSGRGTKGERPKLDMFSSTLRWFENLKFIFSGATRPIRRGDVFKNARPKKPHFSRHFKKVDISVSLHQFQVNYWTSFSQQRGILLNVGRGIHLAAHHQLNIVPYTDGLKRRARADWSISYISCDLTASDIWIQSAINQDLDTSTSSSNPGSPSAELPPTNPASIRDNVSSRYSRLESLRNMERSFFFCVEKVLYTRNSCEELGKPSHKLVIHGARGAWTQSNRDMFFALYDSWRRAQILRKNVSSDALKLFYTEKNNQQSQEKTPFTSPTPVNPASSPFSWGQGTPKVAGSMLDRLLQETEGGATPTAYSEDMSGDDEVKHSLEAMAACTKDDIVHWNWSIELVNSQLLMKGIETQGYVIMSAARASVSQNLHRPVWKERALLSKTTWSGGLESMQYYATVSEEGADLDNIMWLTLDNIGEGEEGRVPGPAGLVGSGKAVGGVVSQVVGVTDSPGNSGIQLQRVVSRCKAEFFYVSYGDTALDDVEASVGGLKMTGSPVSDEEWKETETAMNAFTIVHHDLNVCTNSLQYVMLLDIINNLLLYSEPTLKARTDKYLRMRYQFMLEIDTIDEHRKKIIMLQNHLRQLACTQREKEKEIYLMSGSPGDKRDRLENEASEIKDQLHAMSEDLDMMIRCYKETQMSSSQRQSALRGGKEGGKLRRRGEICFSKAAWRLTEIDGQLGIADINISNFLFTRSNMSDDSVENLLEMGWVNVRNLLPNQLYENVLTPTELKRDIPVDRQRTVRVYSRERARVGGISVKDHFEINVSPLTIGITAHFFKKMIIFAFPEKDAEVNQEEFEMEKKQKKKNRKSKNANFYVECPSVEKDDVERMKERAERNKLFIYIKIPEVPIKVSYKGEKEKNQILDVADFQLQVPTLEYHNVTWTWLDLLLAVKSRTRESLVTQAIKQKFLRNKANTKEEQAPGEEEKARMLLGNSSVPGAAKPSKRFLNLRK